MAITITNPNAAAYEPVLVSAGVYHIRAYLPGGPVTLSVLNDVEIPTGLLITVPTGDQALIEPYTNELDGYPVNPLDLQGQTDGVLTLTVRARRDTVASNYVINDQDIIAVLVDQSPAVIDSPEASGIPGPRGPQGETGPQGPAATTSQLWDAASTTALPIKSGTNQVSLRGGLNGVKLGDDTNTAAMIVTSALTSVTTDLSVTGITTLANLAADDVTVDNITIATSFNPTTITTDSVTLNNEPVLASDATTKTYVDTELAALELDLTDNTYLPIAGGTMTGQLNMDSGSIAFPVTSTGTSPVAIGNVVSSTANTITMPANATDNILIGETVRVDSSVYTISGLDYLNEIITLLEPTGWSVNTVQGFPVSWDQPQTGYSGIIQGLTPDIGADDIAASQGYVRLTSVPVGGLTSQVLGKTSNDGYATAWVDANDHIHEIADVTGLQTSLDGKAPIVHTHVEADITDLGDYATNTDLALKADTTYVDTQDALALPLIGGNLTGDLTISADPFDIGDSGHATGVRLALNGDIRHSGSLTNTGGTWSEGGEGINCIRTGEVPLNGETWEEADLFGEKALGSFVMSGNGMYFSNRLYSDTSEWRVNTYSSISDERPIPNFASLQLKWDNTHTNYRYRITSEGGGTKLYDQADDIAIKADVDASLNSKLDTSGGLLTGSLDVGDYAGSTDINTLDYGGVFFNATGQTSIKVRGVAGNSLLITSGVGTALQAERNGNLTIAGDLRCSAAVFNGVPSYGGTPFASATLTNKAYVDTQVSPKTPSVSPNFTGTVEFDGGIEYEGGDDANAPSSTSSSGVTITAGGGGSVGKMRFQTVGPAAFSPPNDMQRFYKGTDQVAALTVGGSWRLADEIYVDLDSSIQTTLTGSSPTATFKLDGITSQIFFGNGNAEFTGTLKSSNMIDIGELQTQVAASTDFADFQSRIASMVAFT